MRKVIPAFSPLTLSAFIAAILLVSSPAPAQDAGQIESFTLEGGPIASHHFQSGDNNFNQRHTLIAAKISTRDYGNWGLYTLNPNSVDDPSVGFGYVTDPYTIPIGGPVKLELNGIIGLVTGYQDYPVPLLAAEARLALYEHGPWNAGISMAVMPYIAEDPTTYNDKFGIVGTSPFLSIRYNFQ